MNDIEEKLKAFHLDDEQLLRAMQCVQMTRMQQDHRNPYVVETVIVRDGKSVVTHKEETYV